MSLSLGSFFPSKAEKKTGERENVTDQKPHLLRLRRTKKKREKKNSSSTLLHIE